MRVSVDGSGGGVITWSPLARFRSRLETMVDSTDAAHLLADIERLAREVEAVPAQVVAEVNRRGLYRDDGHLRLTGWLRTVVNMPSPEAHRIDRLSKLVAAFPEVARRLESGELGVAQANRLAAAHANRRVAWSFPSFFDLLLDKAVQLPVDDFRQVVDHWERLADADGAHRHAEMVHECRDATVNVLGDTTFVDAHLGNLHGALVKEVFERFCQRELDRDIAERDANGPAPESALPRTAGQRRADALVAVFAAAAGRMPVAVEPLVNIVIDADTFEAALDALQSGEPLPSLAGRPETLHRRRCHTTAGYPVDPVDTVVSALTGQVRRVVVDGKGVVIDLGRRSRLFTGASREAVFLRGRRCIWPGCGIPVCEVDHRVPWSEGGTTSPDNADPLCRRHNKLKATGYNTRQHPETGVTTVIRPDGRPIAPV